MHLENLLHLFILLGQIEMTDSTIQYMAIFGAVAILVVFASELRRWHNLGNVVSSGQKRIRIWLIGLMEIAFILMFIGPWIVGRKYLVIEIIYWTTCIFLVLAVVVVAIFDVKVLIRSFANVESEICRELRGEERLEE